MNDAIPWYRSPVFVNLIVSVIMQVLSVLHVASSVAEADLAKLVDLVFQVLAIGFAGIAAWKRGKSDIQPLAMSKKSADTKNISPENDTAGE